MSATVKSIDDLNGFNILGLKDFRRAGGVCTKGVKKDLLRLAKLYFSYPVLRLPDGTGPNAANASGGVGGSSNWNTAAAGAGGSDQDAAGATASSVFDNSSQAHWVGSRLRGTFLSPRSSLLRR